MKLPSHVEADLLHRFGSLIESDPLVDGIWNDLAKHLGKPDQDFTKEEERAVNALVQREANRLFRRAERMGRRR
jgi:hypothetical protein